MQYTPFATLKSTKTIVAAGRSRDSKDTVCFSSIYSKGKMTYAKAGADYNCGPLAGYLKSIKAEAVDAENYLVGMMYLPVVPDTIKISYAW